MTIIKFVVKGQHLHLKTDLRRHRITSDTLNQFKCQFEFGSDWDGYETRVYFKNASFNITKVVIPDASGYCYIPWEVLAHTGVILCSVTGIKYVDGNVLRLTTNSVRMFVHNSNEGSIGATDYVNPTPTEYEQYIKQVRQYAFDALDAKNATIEAKVEAELAELKIENMTVSATDLPEGSSASVTKTEYDDHFDLEFGIPAGHSPEIIAEKDDGITTIYVDGVEAATVEDGANGQDGVDGADGNDGADGYSPSASVSKVGDTATITVTDKNGTTTASISDGADAQKNVWYGTCTTDANEERKVVTTSSGDFVLSTGNIVQVEFSKTNTAGRANLVVDSTTETPAYSLTGDMFARDIWKAGEVVSFVYNGVTFVMLEKGCASTSNYGITMLSSSTQSTDESLAATPKAVKTAYDLADGKSTVSVSQVVSTGTNIADITIDGTTTKLYAPSGGGDSSIFIAEFNVTTYADIYDAYDSGQSVICEYPDNGNSLYLPLLVYQPSDDLFVFTNMYGYTQQWALISQNDGWDDGTMDYASTDVATQLRNGLMSALDWQKLDGIESGAEVNVQSDWNQSTNTADDYIKNKPTIPSQPSDIGAQEALVSGTNIKTLLNNSLLGSGNITITDLGLLDIFYPVGSYYETSDGTFDPNVSWGGTWSLETEGLFHVSAGSSADYTIGNTDGAETVQLTTSDLPAHTHGNKSITGWFQFRRVGNTANAGSIVTGTDGIADGSNPTGQTSTTNAGTVSTSSTTHQRISIDASHTHDSVGDDGYHENRPPYVAVNRWHRTA